MRPERAIRFEVPDRETLRRLASAPLPLGASEASTAVDFFRVPAGCRWRRLHAALRRAARTARAFLAVVLVAVALPPDAPGQDDPRARDEQPCSVARQTPLPLTLMETSGLALSRRQPDRLWSHNDGGAPPDLHLLRTDGRVLGRGRVVDAENEDWEDIAAGPCPAGDCLFIADIGDNDLDRDEVSVYRVAEPEPGQVRTDRSERIRLRYPDGERNAEALFVLPSGTAYIVTKGDEEPIEIYRVPRMQPDTLMVLERVAALTDDDVRREDRVTGAAASPDGRWVALRTYSTLLLFPVRELLAGRSPALRVDLRPLAEPQGEGVALRDDGTVFLTSEAHGRTVPPTFTALRCRLPE